MQNNLINNKDAIFANILQSYLNAQTDIKTVQSQGVFIINEIKSLCDGIEQKEIYQMNKLK